MARCQSRFLIHMMFRERQQTVDLSGARFVPSMYVDDRTKTCSYATVQSDPRGHFRELVERIEARHRRARSLAQTESLVSYFA